MPLDEFGKLAAAELALYPPILCIAFYVTLKKGFSRREGWIFLFIFSLVRVLGAAITLATKLQPHPSTGLFTAAAILQGIGLSPLLLATLGFISAVAKYGHKIPYTRLTGIIRLLLTVALILGIVAGTKSSPDNDASTISDGRTFSKVASALFFIGFVTLFGVHVLLWSEKEHIATNHRKLLLGVSLALPPLFIRMIYGLLNSASSSSQNRWSPISGTWWIYLIMGLITEYLVVSTYAITGLLARLDEDEDPQARGVPVAVARNSSDGLMEMGLNKLQQLQDIRQDRRGRRF